jgi:hypothetical protein
VGRSTRLPHRRLRKRDLVGCWLCQKFANRGQEAGKREHNSGWIGLRSLPMTCALGYVSA